MTERLPPVSVNGYVKNRTVLFPYIYFNNYVTQTDFHSREEKNASDPQIKTRTAFASRPMFVSLESETDDTIY